MRRLHLKSPANLDYMEAVAYYEAKEPGLGRKFEAEIEKLFFRIREHPEHFPKLKRVIRKALLPRFKHTILFTETSEEIGILAIYHPRRNPAGLHERL